jgi:magnesium chelatase subunit D
MAEPCNEAMMDISATSPWNNAMVAAALFAVDPAGTGGVLVRSMAGPVREQWLAQFRALLPITMPVRRIPLQVPDSRLLGGLDLAATLRAGRPIAERGILAQADNGIVVLAMAERLTPMTVARLAAAMDRGEVAMERDGMALRNSARVGVIALDEGIDDERPPAALLDRLAFHLDFSGVQLRDMAVMGFSAEQIVAARSRLPAVSASMEILEALCTTAQMLGIASLRAPLLALQVARVAAALVGRDAVSESEAALAGRLVLAPRATQLPTAASPEEETPEDTPPPQAKDSPGQEDRDDQQNQDQDITPEQLEQALNDIVLAATQAAMPAGLLAQLQQARAGLTRARSSGRAGALQHSGTRGRPAGVRRGEPRGGVRLNVIETLRAAAPWQRLRRRTADQLHGTTEYSRIEVRPEDFHVTRYQQRTETTTIFVVDASGSAALHRLAEAKGAVELLLADCYVRRDRVAVIAFRGRGAEVLLPPTRSLVRAKRSLAGLPGGGGTPLALGIEAAVALADAVRRRGETPTIVLLTDGRANIARDGGGGRARAEADALAAARQLRIAGCMTLFVDTSPQPSPPAQRLAAEMGALYLALPYADAVSLSRAVREVGQSSSR